MANPGLIIGESQEMLGQALEFVLGRRGFKVLGVVPTAPKLQRLVAAKRPRLCLIDQYLGDRDAVEVIADLLARSPETKTIMLAAEGDPAGVARALHAGAFGYVHKNSGVAALVSALHRVNSGEIAVDVLPDHLPATFEAAEVRARATQLTQREQQCLELLVEGLGTAAMAGQLGVSPSTLRSHVQALLAKLGVHSRLEAAALAVRYSLLPTTPIAPGLNELRKLERKT
ncbi:MAG TPA: response regulator transcription factor [Amycolatopsis sp.]|jgi:DNA-binding NarL/FixJ family response regulator|nr:response regulator transcription factor [Amycolatopsis sp.]